MGMQQVGLNQSGQSNMQGMQMGHSNSHAGSLPNFNQANMMNQGANQMSSNQGYNNFSG